MFKSQYNPETKIWKGLNVKNPYDRDVSLGQLLLLEMSKHPKLVNQVNDNNGVEVTCGEMFMKSCCAAQKIEKMNLTKDDVIGIIARNNHNLAPIVIGALSACVPINPLDCSFTKDEIKHMFNITRPKLIFCEHDVYHRVKSALDELKINPKFIIFGDRIDDLEFIEDFLLPDHGIDGFYMPKSLENGEKTIAIIMCSSGSTGYPKGVSLSHAILVDRFCIGWGGNTCDDVGFSFSSLYWMSGLSGFLYGCLAGSKRIITTDDFDPNLYLRIIEKYRVTLLTSPPYQMVVTSKSPNFETTDFSSVRLFAIGGSLVSPEVLKQFKSKVPNGMVSVGYGLTEIGGGITYNTTDRCDVVGLVVPNSEVKIVDDAGQSLGPNEEGEICFRSKYTFTGYYKNPEHTNDVLKPEGWFHTGDIGYFNNVGLLVLRGRRKEILKYRNYQISPIEIEDVIIKHKMVNYVSVVGIPDDISTDLPAAIIQTEGIVDQGKLRAEIISLVAEKLSDCKQLRGGVYFMDSLPLTASGKIIRRIVLAFAIEQYKKSQNINNELI